MSMLGDGSEYTFLTMNPKQRIQKILNKIVAWALIALAISLVSGVEYPLELGFASKRVTGDTAPDTLNPPPAPRPSVPIVLWHEDEEGVHSIALPSGLDLVTQYVTACPTCPIRGFVIGQVSGTTKIFAHRNLLRRDQPELFGSSDLWGTHTGHIGKESTIMYRLLPDVVMDYNPPVVGKLKKNRTLKLKVPRILSMADGTAKVVVTEIFLTPIEDEVTKLQVPSPEGEYLYETSDKEAFMPRLYPVGNGVYSQSRKTEGELVGIVTSWALASRPPPYDRKAIAHVVPILRKGE